MAPEEFLKQTVVSIDPATVPTRADWDKVEAELNLSIPRSLQEFLDTFGHGTWGRDLLFLHPKGATFQGLQMKNLLRLKTYVDPAFASYMPTDNPGNWQIMPVGTLPYRTHIFQDLQSEEIIIYDGDYYEQVRTGLFEPAAFIMKSAQWPQFELPRMWMDFAQANFPPGVPVFTAICRREADRFIALGP